MAISLDFRRRLRGRAKFRLRTMLLVVTLCGAALALMNAIGPLWSAIFFFAMLLVSAHIVGNAIGNRLRDQATADAALDAEQRPHFATVAAPPRPAKRLAIHAPLGKAIAVLTLLGAVGGGALGKILFSGHATHAALVVGTISAGVLGGFAAFCTSSFFRVSLAAAWQAHFEKPPRPGGGVRRSPARSVSEDDRAP